MTFALLLSVAAITTLATWFGWRLASIIKADGYGMRSSSGLPRDWSPTELPSLPYSAQPHT